MDLNDYWQENKRFVLTVLGGAILFMIGNQLISSVIGDELRSKRSTRDKLRSELRQGRYIARDLNVARGENKSLLEAQEVLEAQIGYPTRTRFKLDSAKGTAGHQYFTAAQDVREDILRRAGRRNIRIAKDLGLPALAPTRDDEIARYLDALDLVERVLDYAIQERVDRVDQIEIKIDPGLRGRKGVGRVERTRVKMKMTGPSGPMMRVLAATQSPQNGQSILIEELEVVPERTQEDEVRLEVTFLAPRLAKQGGAQIETDEEGY
jgi:hypothetical protein